ncbi:MAG: alpha-L-rhamnosidase [Gemmatimonadetes bacterium]|nr:MAG: alpha-L-rhamnosidase [Gemmatimonadota bacterium]
MHAARLIPPRWFLLTTAAASLALSSRPSAAQAPGFHVEGLRTEWATNPIGIDEPAPRLTWTLHAERRGTRQSAYEIRVAAHPDSFAAPLWTSGRVASGESVSRPYGGPALRPGRRYHWQVRAWDDRGQASPWSATAFWETGLMGAAQWKAKWIVPDLPVDTTRSNPAPMLRAEFALDGTVASARAYVTSHGLYEMEINGRRVGTDVLTPGWTSYDKRLQYQTYDVTDLVQRGANAVGVTLGDGWYRGRLAWEKRRNTYGKDVALLAQIVVRYTDGREQVIGTDGRWKVATGPIVASDIYNGESYDARLERAGWSRAGYADADWKPARVASYTLQNLVSPLGPPIRRIEEVKPIAVLKTPAGETVFDMGQNMVGWVRLRVRGPAGTTVRLQHAEVLDKQGNFYTANLRTAQQSDSYTLKGSGDETFEPHFTFHGFRYVKVEGFPGTPGTDAVTGIVVHSDMPRTGSFATSDPMLNQLYHNIVWGQKGNFVGVPTDCPQRDERLGWTGDAQVFSRTAAFNFDVAGFFTNWLHDLAADQRDNGSLPDVIPDVLTRNSKTANTSSSGWGDATVIVPWTMYLAYGDVRLLERQYPSMRAYVEYQRRTAGDKLLWNSGWHYGDWLAFATTRADYPGATTDKDLIATAFFAHSTDLLARSAKVLGKTEDARVYRDLFERIRAAWTKEYSTASGRLSSNTQTAYALALEFGLLPEARRADAGTRLAADVRSVGHLTTGFLGTPYLTDALTATGHLAEAYRLLLNKRYPSWLYPITQGATTIWERWDGQKPDSSFQDVGMNSFNHYAYGAIGDWMVRTVAGLDLDESQPGYRHLFVAPQPGGGLTSARAELQTPYGSAASGWTIANGRMRVTVRVPPNARATVHLPAARLGTVTESGRAVATAEGVTSATQSGDIVVVSIGSGEYGFEYPAAASTATPPAAGTSSR